MEARENGLSHCFEYRKIITRSLAKMPEETPKYENSTVARARELVLAHGWNSTSFQIINPGIVRWFSVADDAVVGYITANRIRVVVGAPVCREERLSDVSAEFEADARRAGECVCYFAAEARLESIYADSPDHTRFLLGAQPTWRPENWASSVSNHKSLRTQLNRAKNKGITVSEWPNEIATQHPQLRKCLRDWLASKGLPPLHFMVESETLARLEGRRVFVAERDGDVYGFVVLSPVAERNGWLFEQFPHRPGSPNGTVELMIDTAMRSLGADGYQYATLGLSPLSTRAEVEPFHNPVWLGILLTWFRKHGRRFYNFDGLDAFKAKLRPERWEPVFAVSNESQVSFKTLYAIASAFSGNAPFRLIGGGLVRAVATEIGWLKRRVFHK